MRQATTLLLLVLASAATARAQCLSDDDCEDIYYCDLGSDESAARDAGLGEDSPGGGTCEARESECQSDEDCSHGGRCESYSEQPEIPFAGYCIRAREPEFSCRSDGDCPEPAVCSPRSECQIVFERCTEASECDPPYDCLIIDPGEGICFPPGDECEATEECPEGWSCEPIPEEVEWYQGEASCLPPGFRLLFEGKLEATDAPTADESDIDDGSQSAIDPDLDAGAPAMAEPVDAKDGSVGSPEDASRAPGKGGTEGPETKSKGGGCASVTPSGNEAVALPLMALLAILRRRSMLPRKVRRR